MGDNLAHLREEEEEEDGEEQDSDEVEEEGDEEYDDGDDEGDEEEKDGGVDDVDNDSDGDGEEDKSKSGSVDVKGGNGKSLPNSGVKEKIPRIGRVGERSDIAPHSVKKADLLAENERDKDEPEMLSIEIEADIVQVRAELADMVIPVLPDFADFGEDREAFDLAMMEYKDNLAKYKERKSELEKYLTFLQMLKAGRPKTRAGCKDVPRPCPFVSCVHNMFVNDDRVDTIGLLAHDPMEVNPELSCVLDIVQKYPELTLEDVGRVRGFTRERARQIEAKAIKRMRARGYGDDVVDYLRDGHGPKEILP